LITADEARARPFASKPSPGEETEMKALSGVLVFVAALINLAPVSGVLSASGLEGAYGVTIENSNLEILLRHRALLFGIVGCLLVAAVFRSQLRPIAFSAGLFSMLSFVIIAALVGNPNDELKRIIRVDLVGIAALLIAALLDFLAARSPATRPGDAP
jgi:hypothetical protein